MREKVAVVGLGYVGLATSLSLTMAGIEVVGVDVNPVIVESLNRGRPHIHEPGFEEALRDALDKGLFHATTSYEETRGAGVYIISVGTPQGSDGSADLSAVWAAGRGIARVLRDAPGSVMVLLKSTSPPGTTRRLARLIEKESGRRLGEELTVAFNPEFLREGHALEDTVNANRVIIGYIDRPGGERALKWWGHVYQRLGRSPRMLLLTAETAEMVKYANNVYLATKISFANQLARICQRIPNCDILDVVDALGLDPRINNTYMRPGPGYGGSCLPKDTKALASYAESLGMDAPLLRGVDALNSTQPAWLVEEIERAVGPLRGRRVALLGLTFKAGSCDLRESKSLELARLLRERGAVVVAHDPCLEGGRIDCEALARHGAGCDILEPARNLDGALEGAEIVVVATEWPIYAEALRAVPPGSVVVDARRVLGKEDIGSLERRGVRVLAIGRGAWA